MASELKFPLTDKSPLAQGGPTAERAFERTELLVFEECEKVLLRAASNAREFHA